MAVFLTIPSFAGEKVCPKLEGNYKLCQTLEPQGVLPDESVVITQGDLNGVTTYQFSYSDGEKIEMLMDGLPKISSRKDANGGKFTVTDLMECKEGTATWDAKADKLSVMQGYTSIKLDEQGNLIVSTQYSNGLGAQGVFTEKCSK